MFSHSVFSVNVSFKEPSSFHLFEEISFPSLKVSSKRLIKLNNQAQKIISELDELWNYSKDFVSHKFKKEAKRLGIPDIRFHDLRRTFGYNLIRQGRPIYEVSKLLGHSSVTTTERHYAPLLATEIDDFVL